jgi:hypothetical protein
MDVSPDYDTSRLASEAPPPHDLLDLAICDLYPGITYFGSGTPHAGEVVIVPGEGEDYPINIVNAVSHAIQHYLVPLSKHFVPYTGASPTTTGQAKVSPAVIVFTHVFESLDPHMDDGRRELLKERGWWDASVKKGQELYWMLRDDVGLAYEDIISKDREMSEDDITVLLDAVGRHMGWAPR